MYLYVLCIPYKDKRGREVLFRVACLGEAVGFGRVEDSAFNVPDKCCHQEDPPGDVIRSRGSVGASSPWCKCLGRGRSGGGGVIDGTVKLGFSFFVSHSWPMGLG